MQFDNLKKLPQLPHLKIALRRSGCRFVKTCDNRFDIFLIQNSTNELNLPPQTLLDFHRRCRKPEEPGSGTCGRCTALCWTPHCWRLCSQSQGKVLILEFPGCFCTCSWTGDRGGNSQQQHQQDPDPGFQHWGVFTLNNWEPMFHKSISTWLPGKDRIYGVIMGKKGIKRQEIQKSVGRERQEKEAVWERWSMGILWTSTGETCEVRLGSRNRHHGETVRVESPVLLEARWLFIRTKGLWEMEFHRVGHSSNKSLDRLQHQVS